MHSAEANNFRSNGNHLQLKHFRARIRSRHLIFFQFLLFSSFRNENKFHKEQPKGQQECVLNMAAMQSESKMKNKKQNTR